MPGNNGEARRSVPMGHRDSGVGRSGDSGRNAGNNNERNAAFPQVLRLLGAAPEDERISAFEAHHLFSGERRLRDQGVGIFLFDIMGRGLLTDEDPLCTETAIVQK